MSGGRHIQRAMRMAGLVLALGLGCKGYRIDAPLEAPPGWTPKTYDAAPSREVTGSGVVTAGSPGGASGTTTVVSTMVGTGGAGGTGDAGPYAVDSGAGGSSAIPDAGSGEGGANPGTCMACDPLAPACAPRWACYPGIGGGWCCLPAGDTGEAGSCMEANSCAPGNVCVTPLSDPNQPSFCRKICDRTMPGSCYGTRCAATSGSGNVGYCTP
jgi:hypothetical protein